MSIVGIISMKGGVGKTSTTANLASAIASRLGPGRVSVIDLDPQNAVHWHFGLEDHGEPGICEQALAGGGLLPVARDTSHGVACVPYGPGAEESREQFEALLAREPGWLAEQIAASGLDDNAVVLLDTPPGPSVYLRQVLACADFVLIVVLADAGSYATIPAMESWIAEMAQARPEAGHAYLLNQVDATQPLNRDVCVLLRQHLGARLAPVSIHDDEAVREALAFQQPVLSYDPHGQASHDVARLASWLVDVLSR